MNLMMAIKDNCLKDVITLTRANPEYVQSFCNHMLDHRKPLSYAIMCGRVSIVRVLLQLGADPNTGDEHDEEMSMCTYLGNSPARRTIFHLLVAHGAIMHPHNIRFCIVNDRRDIVWYAVQTYGFRKFDCFPKWVKEMIDAHEACRRAAIVVCARIPLPIRDVRVMIAKCVWQVTRWNQEWIKKGG